MSHSPIKLLTSLLAIFLTACGGGGGGGDGSGGISNFQVPTAIVSELFRECLQAQAAVKGWRGIADVRSIECQRAPGSDYGRGVETLEGVQVFANLEEIIMYGSGNLALGQVPAHAP